MGLFSLRNFVNGIWALFMPNVCTVCGASLITGEECVCRKCIRKLPATGYQHYRANPVEKTFWGRVDIYSGFSGFFYRKEQALQRIVHEFKYNNNPKLAQIMGRELGRMISEKGMAKDYDFVVPVPLHPKKLAKRGYNQTLYLCKGISDVTGLPVDDTILLRAVYSESQTHKSRFDRWIGVTDNFAVSDYGMRLEGVRLLLVDDVLTTGATLEACCMALQAIPQVRIGIVTLGCASN